MTTACRANLACSYECYDTPRASQGNMMQWPSLANNGLTHEAHWLYGSHSCQIAGISLSTRRHNATLRGSGLGILGRFSNKMGKMKTPKSISTGMPQRCLFSICHVLRCCLRTWLFSAAAFDLSSPNWPMHQTHRAWWHLPSDLDLRGNAERAKERAREWPCCDQFETSASIGRREAFFIPNAGDTSSCHPIAILHL